jgi:hypothetical protein
MARTFSRDFVKFLLVTAMAICLPITMAGEAVALAFDGKPIGNDAGTTADIFGWLFAAAFFAVFVLVLIEQDRRLRAGHRPARSADTSH